MWQKAQEMIKHGALIIGIAATVGGFIIGAVSYSAAIDLFALERFVVSGTALVDEEEVVALTGVEPGASMFSLPLDSLQQRVEGNPFIQVATASRQFPRTLRIRVQEREPLAYLNAGTLYCIDPTGYVMPLPAAGLHLGIPILSGMTATDSLRAGAPAYHAQIESMVEILTDIRSTYPGLYPQISELVHTEDDDYVLFTAEGATRILLGRQEFTRKIRLLEAFWATVGPERSWADYEYIDLRYRKQVIVQEQT